MDSKQKGEKVCPVIVQSVRDLKPGGGSSGVAYFLEKEFQKLGYHTERFTLENLGIKARRPTKGLIHEKLRLLNDVILYSILGTIRLKKKYKKLSSYVVLCHGDSMTGDIYINHGCHKAMLLKRKDKWRMLFRNPLHLFLLLREEIRHKLSIHRFIICFSEYDIREMMEVFRIPRERFVIIPNGVDVERFKPDNVSRKNLRQSMNVADNEFVLIFVGHEFVRKGLGFAIRSLKHLPENVKLWAVGGDDLRIRMHQKLAQREGVLERVSFLGKRYDTQDLYNAADVFVLPTDFEPWGLVGTEALACGKPILMTRTGGITTYLNDGENGYFIRQDPNDIAEKVRLLMNDRALYHKMSKTARERVLVYSWDKIAEQYIELINRICKEKC